jgi:hypothetical protein
MLASSMGLIGGAVDDRVVVRSRGSMAENSSRQLETSGHVKFRNANQSLRMVSDRAPALFEVGQQNDY